MHEDEWTRSYLIPLLNLLGYRNVRFKGGAAEMGRDVVFADYDRFSVLRYYSAQVKHGNIGAGQRKLTGIRDQLRTAYETRYEEPTNGREYRMSGVYFIASGTISDQAQRYLKEHTGQWLHILDGDGLDTARAAAPRVSNSERASLLALAAWDIRKQILPLAQEVASIVPDSSMIHFNPTVLSVRNIEKLIDFAMHELDFHDVARFQALYVKVLAFNGMYLKIPVGSCDSSAIPTIARFRDLAGEVLEGAKQCSDTLDFILQSPRPAPGERLPSSADSGQRSGPLG